ncbi:MAG: co-chaperone GroES [Nanoarchaeota archaeon]
MGIIPIGERVLLKPVEEEKTAGGIYIPESAMKDKKEGWVEAAGTTKEGKELPVKKGDRVIYGGYSHEEVEVNRQKFILVEFKDIVAKVE